MLRVARHAGDREHAASAKRTDQAPGKIAEEARIDLCLDAGDEKQREHGRDADAEFRQ